MIASDPLSLAEAALASGRPDEAVAIVGRAAAANHPDALFRMAIWRLVGEPLARDLAVARSLLARAGAAGRTDATLMLAALTANGSGAPADWRAALHLLRGIANTDAAAQRQLALLDAMTLDESGAPCGLSEPEILSSSPLVARYAGFLSNAECEHIARASVDLLAPSVVIDPRSGQPVPNPIRTSYGMVIGPTREDLVIRAINHRIAMLSGTLTDQGEALSVLRYGPGQQYRLHLDTIAGAANQRIKTVLLYLNQGFTGGETAFPDLNLTITPRIGDAILFDNADDAGTPYPRSRHAGLPVTRGYKWLATRWIRARPLDPWNWAAS